MASAAQRATGQPEPVVRVVAPECRAAGGPDGKSEIRNPRFEIALLSDIIEEVTESTPPLVSVRSHPWCLEHRPGLGHPEQPQRVRVVLDALGARVDNRWAIDHESPLPREEDISGVLKWVHDSEYIARVREAAERGSGFVDSEDCTVSKGTYRSAVAAAGLALQAALDLLNGRLERAFLVVRPPSHHARRDRAAGYCFLNSVAVAAEAVAQGWGRPVVVADIGALHGDGVQAHFYDRADVGFVSVHRFPAFPGSGGADETGSGAGAGTTRNVPVAGGSGDDVFCAAFEQALYEICGTLEPAAIVLAAGFDGHRSDPLGGLALTSDGFARLTSLAVDAAERWADGKILSFLEGGFELEALAKSARIHVEELAKTSSHNQDHKSPSKGDLDHS